MASGQEFKLRFQFGAQSMKLQPFPYYYALLSRLGFTQEVPFMLSPSLSLSLSLSLPAYLTMPTLVSIHKVILSATAVANNGIRDTVSSCFL